MELADAGDRRQRLQVERFGVFAAVDVVAGPAQMNQQVTRGLSHRRLHPGQSRRACSWSVTMHTTASRNRPYGHSLSCATYGSLQIASTAEALAGADNIEGDDSRSAVLQATSGRLLRRLIHYTINGGVQQVSQTAASFSGAGAFSIWAAGPASCRL